MKQHGSKPGGQEKGGEEEELSESMLEKKQGSLIQFMFTQAKGFESGKNWTQFAIGMHHTLGLTESGK